MTLSCTRAKEIPGRQEDLFRSECTEGKRSTLCKGKKRLVCITAAASLQFMDSSVALGLSQGLVSPYPTLSRHFCLDKENRHLVLLWPKKLAYVSLLFFITLWLEHARQALYLWATPPAPVC
jgi:hypothetical protein